ncbi:MAG: SelB C-terminal domain-containing protein [Sulfuritalea sp.]|nr:SelB C-terminal domain-containing protein [Sulfuritalea sp.]
MATASAGWPLRDRIGCGRQVAIRMLEFFDRIG